MTQEIDCVISEHYQNVFNQAFRNSKINYEDAEDITQQVFLAYFRFKDKIRGDCKLSVWLYSVCANQILMHFRNRKYKIDPHLDYRHIFDITESELLIEKTQISDPIDYELMFKYLSPNEKNAILLTIQGACSKEAAIIMNISVPAVKSLKHRARLQIKRNLKSREPEQLPKIITDYIKTHKVRIFKKPLPVGVLRYLNKEIPKESGKLLKMKKPRRGGRKSRKWIDEWHTDYKKRAVNG